MHWVDLRSDTVTQPTPAMRAAGLRAEVGDDVFGDDPSVNALQERLAGDLGFEAGLFLRSDTQSNLLALMAHCGRGDECLVGMDAHTYKYEGGGAVPGSIQPQPIMQAEDGTLPLPLQYLADAGARACALADALGRLPGVAVDGPHTNIVFMTVPAGRENALAEHLADRGIRIAAGRGPRIRLVTHLDVDDAGLARTVAAFREFFAA